MKRAQEHPVVVIYGDEWLLRERFLAEYCQALREQGRRIVCSEPEQLPQAMLKNFFVENDKLAVVVSQPDKVDLSLYLNHKDKDCILILHYEGTPKGNTKWGKFAKDQFHKEFKRPSEWKRPEAGVEFLLSEAKALGKSFSSEKLPWAIVGKAGPDLGVLRFELLKAALLSGESETISVDDVKGSIASLTEASVDPILRALAARSARHLARALSRVYITSKYDPTMKVARIVGARVLSWFQVSCLDQLPPEAIAEELKINPWYLKKQLFPPARKWGKIRLVRLIKVLAQAERSVLSGEIAPWQGFVASLLEEVSS